MNDRVAAALDAAMACWSIRESVRQTALERLRRGVLAIEQVERRQVGDDELEELALAFATTAQADRRAGRLETVLPQGESPLHWRDFYEFRGGEMRLKKGRSDVAQRARGEKTKRC